MATKTTKNTPKPWKGRVKKGKETRCAFFRTKAEALDWEAKERKADWTIHTASCLTLMDWCNKYLDYSRVKHSTKTYRDEKRPAFSRLFKCLDPTVDVYELTPARALSFLQKQAGDRSGYAANKDRKNLVAAWNWGMRFLGMPGPNPFRLVDRFPEKRNPRYVPPEEDFWKVFDVAEGQDQVMLAVALYTAARRGEIFRLTWSDVDFPQKRIRLGTRKRLDGTLELDWLPMANELNQALTWWWENRAFRNTVHVFVCEDKYSFCGDYYGKPFRQRCHFMRRLCERASIKPFGFHAIRHLTASILYQKGEPVSVIQATLRHRNPNTTARYLRSLGLEETRSALNSLGQGRLVEFPATKKPSEGPSSEGSENSLGNQVVTKVVTKL